MSETGICNKVSNNKYFDCPARMDGGRHFTDYRPNCYLNNLVRMSNNITSSYDYRQYLIHNADKLMDMNRNYAKEMNGCNECNAKPVPFRRKCDVNLIDMNCHIVNPNGIGTQYKSGLH